MEYYLNAKQTLSYSEGSLYNSKGCKVGTIASTGYLRVSSTLNGKRKQLLAHRVIFFMHHGYLPENIDHIDGDKLNNSIDNLRGVDFRTNMNNLKCHRNGHLVGTAFCPSNKRWKARITSKGKTKHLGFYNCQQEAHEAYLKARKEI